VLGEAGVGKTRLFYEFTHSRHTQGWLCLETWSMSYGKATAYLPVLELLKAYFQIEARDDARRMREKVTGKLLTLDPTLQTTLPAFLALLDVPGEDPQWQALDPSQRRQRTLDALKRLVLRESQLQPLCLIVENLHWVDTETQAWLDKLIESLPTARLLLLVNFRPEYQHGWGSKTYYTQLRLDPLPPESAEELLLGLLGSKASTRRAKKRKFMATPTGQSVAQLRQAVKKKFALSGRRRLQQLQCDVVGIQKIDRVAAPVDAGLDSDRFAAETHPLHDQALVLGLDVVHFKGQMRRTRVERAGIHFLSTGRHVLDQFNQMARASGRSAADTQLGHTQMRIGIAHQLAGVGIGLFLSVYQFQPQDVAIEMD